MLRPSRPMMRPFISSDGRWTADTVISAVWSTITRWMAVTTTSRAFSSASSRALRSMARARRTASCSASSRTCSSSTSLASSCDSSLTRSRAAICSCRALASSSLAVSSSRSRVDQLAVALLEHVRALVELLVALQQAPLERGQLAALGPAFLVEPRAAGAPARPWPAGSVPSAGRAPRRRCAPPCPARLGSPARPAGYARKSPRQKR